jgi:phthalate 4,5-dioxygenase reductase subunit
LADVLHLVVAERHELTPGVAHVTVTTPAGPRRSYSLVDAGSRAPREYAICVRRDAGGRGGSVSLHDDVRVGDVLEVTWPANNFALKRAKRYLFIAGGIGITPIRAMVGELRARCG